MTPGDRNNGGPMQDEYVRTIEIREVAPCFTKPGRIRVEAQTIPEGGEPLRDLLPVLLLRYPGSVAKLDEKDLTLTLNIHDRVMGIFPSGTIGMQNTKDEEEAEQILEEIRTALNEAYKVLISEGGPSREVIGRRLNLGRLSTFQVMKCLPNRIRCRKCGEPSCSSFALKLRSGEADMGACEVLKENGFEDQRNRLEALLNG